MSQQPNAQTRSGVQKPTTPAQQAPASAAQQVPKAQAQPGQPGQPGQAAVQPGRPAGSAPGAQPSPGTPNAGAAPSAQAPTYRPPTAYVYQPKPSILGTGLQRDILSLLIKIAVIAGAVVGLFTFIFGVFQYSSPAMSPAVQSGDLILFNRFDTTYHAQDLIVLSYQGEMQVRRVIATGGNTVDLVDERLIIDGAPQQESNIFFPTHRYDTEIDFPLTVPEGHVFVLGDYREGVTDSRTYGPVRVDDTQGKVISIYRRRGF